MATRVIFTADNDKQQQQRQQRMSSVSFSSGENSCSVAGGDGDSGAAAGTAAAVDDAVPLAAAAPTQEPGASLTAAPAHMQIKPHLDGSGGGEGEEGREDVCVCGVPCAFQVDL